jgi:hypothetical protein
MSNGFERPQWKGNLSGGYWPLCKALHSGHYAQLATMCRCQQICSAYGR